MKLETLFTQSPSMTRAWVTLFFLQKSTVFVDFFGLRLVLIERVELNTRACLLELFCSAKTVQQNIVLHIFKYVSLNLRQ